MANPSKKRPWVVQMRAVVLDKWYDIGAYEEKDRADMEASLARKREPNASWRVVEFEKKQ